MAASRIVLTGASKGIGHAMALKLTRGGAKVLANARDEEALASLVFEAKSLSGRIYPHRCDITVLDELEMLPATAEKRLNRVDALINNAGMSIFQKLLTLQWRILTIRLRFTLRRLYFSSGLSFSCLRKLEEV